MKPENVPDDVVEKMAQAIWDADTPAPELGWPRWEVAVERAANGLWDLPQMVADTRAMARTAAAAAWDDIFGAGFTEGFSTKISMEKTADSYEPAEGPALSEYEKQHRVIVVDHYDDGALEVAYRETVPAAPLTLAARGNHSVDMKVESLISAIARAGGPRLVVESDE